MSNLEQRIDIVQVNLPEPEDLNWLWVKSQKLKICVMRTEKEVVVISKDLIPDLLDPGLAHIVVRGLPHGMPDVPEIVSHAERAFF